TAPATTPPRSSRGSSRAPPPVEQDRQREDDAGEPDPALSPPHVDGLPLPDAHARHGGPGRVGGEARVGLAARSDEPRDAGGGGAHEEAAGLDGAGDRPREVLSRRGALPPIEPGGAGGGGPHPRAPAAEAP